MNIPPEYLFIASASGWMLFCFVALMQGNGLLRLQNFILAFVLLGIMGIPFAIVSPVFNGIVVKKSPASPWIIFFGIVFPYILSGLVLYFSWRRYRRARKQLAAAKSRRGEKIPAG